MNRRWLLPAALVVALLQIGFLFSMIAGRASVLRHGSDIVLQVEPVDPRDLLRGDYVVLTYAISRLQPGLFAERPRDEDLAGDGTVFVRLRAGEDGLWHAVAARFGEPPAGEAGENEVDMRGHTRLRRLGRYAEVPVRYGIERFYVPEGEGRAIEEGIGDRRFRVTVAVGANGTAQIKSLHDGDALLYAEPYY